MKKEVKYKSIKQYAELAGVTPNTILVRVRNGKIKTVKIPKLSANKLIDIIEFPTLPAQKRGNKSYNG